MSHEFPGARFRRAMKEEKPLQIVGTINAYTALMAARLGYRAIYLSGAGVANQSHGLPDIGLTTLDQVLEEVRRITAATELPLLVDIDTGWGNLLMIGQAVKEIAKAGAAGVHIEDQAVDTKRCGHLPGKQVVSITEMTDRIRAAVDAKPSEDFIVIARSDALAVEGMEGLLKRAAAYRDAGADALFPEALTTLEQFKQVRKASRLPVLANMTEFGKTPLFTLEELRSAQVDMVLYPLTITRVMNLAAKTALEELRQTGHQKNLLKRMQTREELYRFLNYDPSENPHA